MSSIARDFPRVNERILIHKTRDRGDSFWSASCHILRTPPAIGQMVLCCDTCNRCSPPTAQNRSEVGARSFGLRVCWVNRVGAHPDELGLTPDYVLTSLAQLTTLVKG